MTSSTPQPPRTPVVSSRGPSVAGVASFLASLTAKSPQLRGELLLQRGAPPSGERLERMSHSPQWGGMVFRNRAVTHATAAVDQTSAFARWFQTRTQQRPTVRVPLLRDAADPVETDSLHVTWFGHASALVELDGVRVLLDPVWSDRCSPSARIGPRRHHAVPLPLADLGHIDAVVISHDHYDHLDMATVIELVRVTTALFLVPLGIGAHLERWGVPGHRFVELDWDESYEVGALRLTCVESQHFSGRWLTRDETLWASWVLAGPHGRVYFSGDTGYFDGFGGIAEAYGPFDVALMAVGAYDPMWRAIHLDPEEAVKAAVDMGSPLLLPIHWCTFNLAPHPWAEPVERMLRAAEMAEVRAVIPRIGERVSVTAPPPLTPWWRPATV